MNRVSNVKAYTAPTLWVDIDDLHVPCAVPTLDATESILEKAKKVTEFTSGKLTQEGYDYTFELFAELLSSNHNFVSFTADELKKKRITVTQIMGVITDWVQFIGSLADSKN